MRFPSLAFALTSLALVALEVQAAPVTMSNAAYAATYVRDCRSTTNFTSTPDRCEVNGVFTQGPTGGAPSTLKEVRETMALGGTTAASSATLALGQAMTPGGVLATQSSIDVAGSAGTLLLRQAAASGSSYARTSGHSLGLQSFQFTGSTGETRTLSNVFDFTSNVTPNTDLATGGATGSIYDPVVWAKTRVTVFSLTSASFDFDVDLGTFDPQSSGWHSQATGLADYRLEAQTDDQGITSSGHTSSTSFVMENGRFYFVESYLGIWARFGGWLDATHTFTNTWGRLDGGGVFSADFSDLNAAAESSDPTITRVGLVNQPHAVVPLPGTLTLLGLGLLGLAGLRRRAHR